MSKYFVTIGVTIEAIDENNAVKIIGDRETNTNLRYKLGRNLNYKS